MIYYAVLFFIIGTIFGSFYNVVGYRIPKGESILYPSSHCTKCNHKLQPFELIPILSYIFLDGKCRVCKEKISCFYPIFEFLTGLSFMFSYLVFGLTLDCLVSIIFISMLLIVIISDYQTMIIPDSVLVVSLILILIVKYFIVGITELGISIIHGLFAFIFMFALKLLGDFIFKRESMGGGDIKLMGIFGIMFGFPMSVVSIFIASIIGFPISLINLKKNPTHEIPFGPYLAFAAIIIVLFKIDITDIIKLLTNNA